VPEITLANILNLNQMKITGGEIFFEDSSIRVSLEVDGRVTPRCHRCGSKCPRIHSNTCRVTRDLNMSEHQVYLHSNLRNVYCEKCNRIVLEKSQAAHPYKRVTPRFALYIYMLCKVMSISAVASHVGLNRKTVAQIDKEYLEKEYGQISLDNIKILSIDEIAVRKGHDYMTVIMNYETGQILWMGKGRKIETLEQFYDKMTEKQRKSIKAVCMDMWPAFMTATKNKLPDAKIVFDAFHVIAAFSKVIDKVRLKEQQEAGQKNKDTYKGSKYILLKNKENLNRVQRAHLDELLELNATICTVMILRDMLKHIWKYTSRTWANNAIENWCTTAQELNIPELSKFCKLLKKHREGILNHCEWPIHNGKIEGTNNKIKVIKRVAFGFRDMRYFELKCIQATTPCGSN
jgi:transposase